MSHKDIITYNYYDSLYVNMTNQCDCHCAFCVRDQRSSALNDLWLSREPSKEDVLQEICSKDLSQYKELVFCGYGEPTCRADDMLWICDQLHAAQREDLPPIRLNTNGHGSLINHRDLPPELEGRLDAVSISLNASNLEEYLRLTNPESGTLAWNAMLEFVQCVKRYVPQVMVTVVDYHKSAKELSDCQELAERLGTELRIRPFSEE